MSKPLAVSRLLITVFAIGVIGSQIGCRSASGSRWAKLNPWSKSAAETAVAGGPKLPSDGATPLIEGVEATLPEAPAVASIAPPAATSPTPETEAAGAVAIPKIEAPGTALAGGTAPPYKTTAPAASAPASPTAVASTGPYDPNGYKPSVATPSQPAGGDDRYGVGNRYASAASPPSGFDSLPPIEPSQPAPGGGRYGLPSVNDTVDRYASAAPTGTPATPPSAVESLDAPPASPGLAAVTPYPSSSPETSAAPAYPIASAAPVAESPSPSAPLAERFPDSGTIGQLPAEPTLPSTAPTASVYAAAPVTPEQPADETASNLGSTVRLTSLPGEYRPGGTGTYRPRVNVASNPSEESKPGDVAPAGYPTTIR